MKKVTPLTDTKIKNAKPKDKEFNLTDGLGLMIRIMPSGSKKWYFNYQRPFTKKRNAISLGDYPSISLKHARELRAEYREWLSQEIDPKEKLEQVAKAKSEKHLNTFQKIAETWLQSRIKADESNDKAKGLSYKYANEIASSLINYVYPFIGKKPISTISRLNLTQMLKPLEASGKLEATKRVAKRVEWVFEYAYNNGLIPQNTARDLHKAFAKNKKKHFPTITPDEIPELMLCINNADIQLQTKCLLEWQLHTMTRPSEAAGTLWREIDFKKMLWTIPARRMKKGVKHIVPISKQAMAILEAIKPLTGHRDNVFPNRNDPRRPMNSQSTNMALKRMGYNKKLVAHGLRALASTTLNEQGFNRDVIEAALAHGDKNIVRGTYNRATYLEQRVELMAWWSNHLENAINEIRLKVVNEV